MQPSEDKSSSMKVDSSGEAGQGSLGDDAGRVEGQENPWSPPQFSLSHLAIAVTAFCTACAVIKCLGVDWFGGFIGAAATGFLVWILVNCVRLVQLSRRDHLPNAAFDAAMREATAKDHNSDGTSRP